MIHYDLLYDGPRLQWPGRGIFRATSGSYGRQWSALQCDPDGGPIPEGSYFLLLAEESAVPNPDEGCQIAPSWKVQRIPSGLEAGVCEPGWVLWGRNRVRLTRLDPLPPGCRVPRGGFYIHDSTKGYTHGCIEVEPRFFEVLRHLIATMHSPHGRPKERLNLLVKYLPGQTTNGGTYRFG